MFGIDSWEFVALALIALLVFGPDKLPKIAADAGRMVRQLREMATGAKADLTRELGPEWQELAKLRDLDPRTFVAKQLLDDDDDGAPKPVNGSSAAGQLGQPGQGTASSPVPAAGASSSGPAGASLSGPATEPAPPAEPAPAEPAPARWDPDAT